MQLFSDEIWVLASTPCFKGIEIKQYEIFWEFFTKRNQYFIKMYMNLKETHFWLSQGDDNFNSIIYTDQNALHFLSRLHKEVALYFPFLLYDFIKKKRRER